jgi:Cu/Ag efflux pump CusA
MMSAFFVRRPTVAIVIAIVTVLGGLVSMARLPIAMFPDIVPPQIIVQATYTGADAVTVEQSVATSLEQQMNGVDNMLYMQSTNANDGTMQLTVTFDVATDPNVDQVNVQNRDAQAQPNLPAEVNQFGLTMRKITGLPLMVASLHSPGSTFDALFLANYANINIIDALYRVPGVGQVLIFGANDYAMRIWVKPDRLAAMGLTVTDLANALQHGVAGPAGSRLLPHHARRSVPRGGRRSAGAAPTRARIWRAVAAPVHLLRDRWRGVLAARFLGQVSPRDRSGARGDSRDRHERRSSISSGRSNSRRTLSACCSAGILDRSNAVGR